MGLEKLKTMLECAGVDDEDKCAIMTEVAVIVMNSKVDHTIIADAEKFFTDTYGEKTDG